MDFELYEKKMEVELYNYVVIWMVVLISLTYCYHIGNIIANGFIRFVAISPVIFLFLCIPYHLYWIHLNFLTVFSISWLANLKLLLFAVDTGPLSNPSISLSTFLAVASLPIKIKPIEISKISKTQSIFTKYPFKILFLAIVMHITINHAKTLNHYNPMILSYIGSIQFYLQVDFTFTSISILIGSILGLDLEPNFNEPYLSASVQDFWTRWNMMASNILRITIYQPVKNMLAGSRWATAVAVVTTFLVSGIFHEVIYYHLLRENPTGEFTLFFVIHGVYVAIEIEMKKRFKKKFKKRFRRKWCLWWLLFVYRVWTFVVVSGLGYWLLCGPIIRSETHVRLMHEYRMLFTWISFSASK